MRFQVPQNLDIKDVIFLGLSFSQMIYIGGAVGFSLFLFFFIGLIPAFIFGGPVLLFALALSFFSYNNQSFIVLLLSAIRFFSRKKMYVWEKDSNETYLKRTLERKSDDSIQPDEYSTSSSDRIKNLDMNLIFSDDSFHESEPDVII